MSTRFPRVRCRSLLRAALPALALAIALLPAFAFAADPKLQPMTPPTPPSGTTDGASFLTLASSFLMVAAVLAVNFLPSKRGHQD